MKVMVGNAVSNLPQSGHAPLFSFYPPSMFIGVAQGCIGEFRLRTKPKLRQWKEL